MKYLFALLLAFISTDSLAYCGVAYWYGPHYAADMYGQIIRDIYGNPIVETTGWWYGYGCGTTQAEIDINNAMNRGYLLGQMSRPKDLTVKIEQCQGCYIEEH
jgi:hypothetical protein